MRRDLAQPLDAGVFHGNVRVEAPGDGAGDEGGAFLLKQLDQPLLPRHQPIDLRRLAVEKSSDGALFDRSRSGGTAESHAIATTCREVDNAGIGFPFVGNVELDLPRQCRELRTSGK